MFDSVYKFNKAEFESVCKGIAGDRMNSLLEYMSNSDFYYAPSSRSYHDNYPGGLYDHCKSIFNEMFKIRSRLGRDWSDLEVLIIAFGHDLCKVGLYVPNIDESGIVTYSYNPEYSKDRGHGTISLKILAGLIPELLNERIAESIVCHMGLWTEDVEDIAQHMKDAQSKDDIVFFTHYADMIASKSSKIIDSVTIINDKLDIRYK